MRTQDLQERVTGVCNCSALWLRSAGFSLLGALSTFHQRRWEFFHWLHWKMDQIQRVTLPFIVMLGWERDSQSNNLTHLASFSSNVFQMTSIVFTLIHFSVHLYNTWCVCKAKSQRWFPVTGFTVEKDKLFSLNLERMNLSWFSVSRNKGISINSDVVYIA